MSQPNYESYRYSLVVKEHHLDTFGHINNATYLEILEEARWEFITQRGFSLGYIQQNKVGPVVLEWNIKFRRELKLRETITIVSQTLAYEGKIGRLQQNILNEKGELACEAVMTFGLFDTESRKLIAPTADWLRAIGLLNSE